jgi:hypothetical protein
LKIIKEAIYENDKVTKIPLCVRCILPFDH